MKKKHGRIIFRPCFSLQLQTAHVLSYLYASSLLLFHDHLITHGLAGISDAYRCQKNPRPDCPVRGQLDSFDIICTSIRNGFSLHVKQTNRHVVCISCKTAQDNACVNTFDRQCPRCHCHTCVIDTGWRTAMRIDNQFRPLGGGSVVIRTESDKILIPAIMSLKEYAVVTGWICPECLYRTCHTERYPLVRNI